MSDGTGGPAGPKVDLQEVLSQVWHRVVGQANKLLEAHESFGFVHFNANLNPSLADILQAFATIDFVLNKLVESGKLEPEEALIAINSRQCILKMKALSFALSANDQGEYERVIGELRQHSR
ncbi:hypothetical protein ROV80_05040 [Stenotrophomonas pavanii]|uniref:hypothetical protein n=1 Tax=Stenotrophomonas pavanii TaxID=487698 RepID=UPI0028953D62|nr:hypothetical protein [Stenotrophomonas pavanii]MDT3454609.1 hypothetical protein [Stenotrophomonas pavanii]